MIIRFYSLLYISLLQEKDFIFISNPRIIKCIDYTKIMFNEYKNSYSFVKVCFTFCRQSRIFFIANCSFVFKKLYFTFERISNISSYFYKFVTMVVTHYFNYSIPSTITFTFNTLTALLKVQNLSFYIIGNAEKM